MINLRRGPLLKPSEKAGHVVRPSHGISKQSRYETLKEKVRTWWEDRFKVGEALREIRDGDLYREDGYSTFEEFCEVEYGWKRAQAYRLIEAAGVKESLKMSPIGDKLVHESQARALAAAPAEKRVEVLEKTAERGPVTARAITETVRSSSPNGRTAKEAKPQYFDKTDYPIPESILEDWQRAESQKDLLRKVSEVRSALKAGLEDQDVIFAELSNSTVADLTNAYTSLKQLIPYAICPSCQGVQRKKCDLCKKRGFISEFMWRNVVPAETKKMREKK